jgi:undecaprenyl-diphosphatase
MSVVFAFTLARMREWYWMMSVALAVAGGLLLNVVLKHAYERARPRFDDPFLTLETYSFPSGHTAGATVFYGVLSAFLVSRTSEHRRRAAWVAAAGVAIALVAFSRIYLGAHYLSDVLAAACSSTAWLVLSLATVRAIVHRRMEGRGVKPARRHWVWIGTAIGIALALGVALLAPVADWLAALEGVLERKSLAQGLLIFGAVSVIGMLLLVPAWIFPIAAGAAFGLGWGIVAAVAASTLAALAAFLVARYLIHDHVGRAARRDKSFAAVDKAVKRDPFKVVALLRMAPVLPSALKSYFLGLTCVDAIAYTAASALGMLPGITVKVYIGHAGRDAFSAGDPLRWALLAAGLAAALALALLVGRAARRLLRLDE